MIHIPAFGRAALSASALAAFTLVPLATQGDANSQIVTAATHADLAASASDLNGVHTHLHHTLNCLVGPGGSGFDSKELDPCANAGKGAIPDATDAAKRKSLEAAADRARAGIAASDLKAAQKDASEASAMLKAK